MVNGSPAVEGAAFAQALSALKERGSNLLIVGALGHVHRQACDRLLGEDAAAPRRRLFVRTEGVDGCGVAPAERAVPGQTRLVVRATEGRSAAATAATDGVAPVATSRVDGGDLDALTAATVEEIGMLAPADREFEPAELRVCFDSLLPLLAEHDEGAVIELLRRVTDRVRQERGMAHYHLPVDAGDGAADSLGPLLDADDGSADSLAPLFDAVIELRTRGNGAEHNWRLVDRDLESGWLPL